MDTEFDYSKVKRKYILIGILVFIIIAALVVYLIINSGTKIKLDEATLCIPNVYDGTEKKLVNVENNDEYTVTNNTATEVGEHTVVLTANDGYVFDNRKKEKNIQRRTFSNSPFL